MFLGAIRQRVISPNTLHTRATDVYNKISGGGFRHFSMAERDAQNLGLPRNHQIWRTYLAAYDCS